MPFNLRPDDPGLEEAFQAAQSNAGNDPITQALNAISRGANSAIDLKKLAAKKAALQQLMQTGEVSQDMTVAPSDIDEATKMNALKKGVKSDLPMNPEFLKVAGKQMGIELPETTTQAQYMDFVKGRPKPLSASAATSLTPEEDAALVAALRRPTNPLPLTLIRYRGPGSKALAQSLMQDPEYNPTTAEINLASGKAGSSASARLTEGGSSQIVARAANSAKEQLDILQQASNEFPRTDLQFMNTPLIAIDKQKYPEAQNWLIALQTARNEWATAQNRGNAPTEALLKEAAVAIPDTITPSQLPGAINKMRLGLEATVRGQMTPVKANTPGVQSAQSGTGQQGGDWKQDPDILAVGQQIKSGKITPQQGAIQMAGIRKKKGYK